jgi:hypothetical protein
LFAVLGKNEVAQLDPVTGAIIRTVSVPDEADALTFDAITGKLYVSSDGGGFYTVDPSLASATFTGVIGAPVFDGIASSGNLLYLVVRGGNTVVYDLSTGQITETRPFINGADDIAPTAGLGPDPAPRGSLDPAPEPGTSIVLAGMALLGLVRKIRLKSAG